MKYESESIRFYLCTISKVIGSGVKALCSCCDNIEVETVLFIWHAITKSIHILF